MKRSTFVILTLFLVGCTSTVEPPAVVAQPDPDILFYDEFEDVKGEWQQIGGVWNTVDGWLIQRTDDPRELNTIQYVQSPRIADASIETVVVIAPDRPSQWTDSAADQELARNIRYIIGAGIIFRMKNRDNYYMFRLAGEEGAVLGKMVDGQWFDIENPRVRDFLQGERIGFFRDNEYRLKVDVSGSRIVCYINDEPVISAKDESFEIGHFGLVTFKTAARFDFVKVKD